MTDDSLSVHGGAGGLTARYDDMLSWAGELESISGEVWDHKALLARIAASPDLAESAVLSPFTAGVVEGQVTSAGAAVVSTSGRLKASALFARTAVEAYRATDEAQAVGARALHAMAVPVILAGDLGYAIDDINARTAAAVAENMLLPGADILDIPGAVFHDVSTRVMGQLYEHPWIIDGLVDDAVLGMGAVGTLMYTTNPVWAVATTVYTARTTGGVFPPFTHEQGTRDLVAFGRMVWLFGEGKGTAEAVTDGAGKLAGSEAAPTSIASIITGVDAKYAQPGEIRIISETGADGQRRWVVEIPGTESWSPVAGSNPMDLSSNVQVMAGLTSAQIQAVKDAMSQRHIPPGEDVLLAGHSQGGIIAAALASDPDFRSQFHVTDVVTAGSPISAFDIPDDVSVLSLEHTTDAVPRLDSSENPDRLNWTTVTQNADGVPIGDGEVVHDTASAHKPAGYAATGALIDSSDDPALQKIKQSLDKFTTADPETMSYQDYSVVRK